MSDEKLCRGPLHREGVILPLKRFYTHKNGSPFSQCIECRNHYLGRGPEAGLISLEDAQPLLDRLFIMCGGKTNAAQRLGLQRNYFSRGQKSIRRQTFNAARKLVFFLDDEKRSKVGEAEVVDAEPLGSVLRKWIVAWMQDRPPNAKSTGQESFGAKNEFMGPIQWLSEKTIINTRRVSGISNGEFPNVPLTQADALLTAIGRPDLLGSEIHVKPNPNWSMEWWLDYMAERGCV